MAAREVVVVLVTAGSVDEAQRLAATLLERRAIACANLIPNVRSYFRWDGELQVEDEVLMVVKTTSDALNIVKDIVAEHHSYDVPEVIAMPVAGGNEAYLDWVQAGVAPVRGT